MSKKVLVEVSYYGHDNSAMMKEGLMKPSDIIRRREKKNARRAMLLQRGEELFGSTKFGDAKEHVKLVLNNPSLRKLDFFANLQEQEARKAEIIELQQPRETHISRQTRQFGQVPYNVTMEMRRRTMTQERQPKRIDAEKRRGRGRPRGRPRAERAIEESLLLQKEKARAEEEL